MKTLRIGLRHQSRQKMVYGHHISPYDIERIIFDSTNKEFIAFAHYISKT